MFPMPSKVLWPAAAAALALSACLSSPDGKPRSKGSGGASVELRFHAGALARAAAGTPARPIDSIHVRVTAADMDAMTFSFGSPGASLSLTDLPPGAGRRFEIGLFQGGRLLYAGETTADLHADRKNDVFIHCLPEFSRVTASVHIPLDFPKVVAGGEMRLWRGGDTLKAPQIVIGELRSFRLEEVPGDRDYAVSVALWDAAGDTLAKAFRADVHVPKGQNVALVMPLAITFSRIQIAMTVAEAQTTSVIFSFPAGRRTPSAFGEAVFSEVHPIPSADEGGDNGEWLELFNRVSDTLDVSGCQIVRDAGTSPSMNATLPSGTLIPPGRGLVVGRSAVGFAHVTLPSSALTLTNTSARLEFACAANRLDTLAYSTSASDTTAARIASGKVTALRPSRIRSRHAASAWCHASLNPSAADFRATPGFLDGSCGE